MSKRKDKSGSLPRSSMTMRSMDRKVQYKNFLEGFSKLELEGASMDEKMDYTTNVIKEANELLQQGSMEDRVKNPTESFLASRVLRAASQMAATCAAGVSGAVHVYDRRELAAHIKEKPEFWSVLFPLEAPATCSLFGAFDGTPPEPGERPRAERKRVERQALAEKKAPANVDKMDKTEEGAEMVARVKRFVTKTYQRTGAPLSYFHTVLDPGSFARSVENVYHLSFLVREGAVSCHVDEEHGLPFIAPVSEEQRSGGGLAKEHQFIVSLDMQRWQDLIKAFKIDQPMMVLKR
ncbi:non-structural maintenance of chromosomes element 4 homolog A [Leguminivora glycinivorella]|uniref:non-structural maintenance of chromosomes element 4 homolog A n=1 Tax=Leguminivora glycinivorella TaxID=1035111 RepID=UPI0020109F1B|nr:non-structural maintenance of chromosomes element 4 homolog A [Leguminivora glycinivorella]